MGSVKILKKKNIIKKIKINPDISPSQCISYIKAKSHIILFPQQSKPEYKEIDNMTFTGV